jgi:hypothetical protein
MTSQNKVTTTEIHNLLGIASIPRSILPIKILGERPLDQEEGGDVQDEVEQFAAINLELQNTLDQEIGCAIIRVGAAHSDLMKLAPGDKVEQTVSFITNRTVSKVENLLKEAKHIQEQRIEERTLDLVERLASLESSTFLKALWILNGSKVVDTMPSSMLSVEGVSKDNKLLLEIIEDKVEDNLTNIRHLKYPVSTYVFLPDDQVESLLEWMAINKIDNPVNRYLLSSKVLGVSGTVIMSISHSPDLGEVLCKHAPVIQTKKCFNGLSSSKELSCVDTSIILITNSNFAVCAS